MPRVYSTTYKSRPLHLDLDQVLSVMVLPNSEITSTQHVTGVRIMYQNGSFDIFEFPIPPGQWKPCADALEFELDLVRAWKQETP